MSQPICALCPHYHPRTDPHAPDRGQTCAAGRRRLEHDVMILRSSYHRLEEQHTAGIEALEPDAEERRRRDLAGSGNELNRRVPAANVPPRSRQPMVSGSRERQIPLTDVADLVAPARTGAVHDPDGDQDGYHSVATVLNEWVGEWHERFFAGHRRPPATVEAMTAWLIGVRLELVCDAEDAGAVVSFAAEVGELLGAVRYHLGEVTPKKQPMWGVPCPRCDVMSQLMLNPEDPDKYRECGNCGKLMTADEYHAHLRELVDQYRASGKLARG